MNTPTLRSSAGALATFALSGTVACTPPAVEEPEAAARRVLEQTLSGLGGADAVAAVRSWEVSGAGRENLSAEVQGIAPGEPTWREHEETLAIEGDSSDVADSLTVAWQRRTPRNDQSLRWRRLIYGPDRSGFVDLASDRGRMGSDATPARLRRGFARRVPHLLLLEAASSPSATWRGEREIDDEPHDVIDIATVDGDDLTLVVSRAPARIVSAAYATHLPTRGDVTVVWRWHDWETAERIGARPGGHIVTIDDVPFQEVTYARFEPDANVAPLLEVPTSSAASTSPDGGAPIPSSPVAAAVGFAATGEVAPGVHVATIDGFGVMLVELEDFVVVVETPEAHPGFETIPASLPARWVSGQHADWIRNTAGDKPVRFAVVSHHHSDHLGGARDVAGAGATLLVPAGDMSATRHMLLTPHRIRGDGLELADTVAIEAVAEARVIEDTSRRIEILPVGVNPHTESNLLVWLPRERIAFQGDLFYYVEGAPFPPPGRGTMNRFTADWLERHEIRPEAIYGVHNRGVAGPEALARSEPSGQE